MLARLQRQAVLHSASLTAPALEPLLPCCSAAAQHVQARGDASVARRWYERVMVVPGDEVRLAGALSAGGSLWRSERMCVVIEALSRCMLVFQCKWQLGKCLLV